MRNISGSLGSVVAHLGGVRGVVAADADHLAARDDRREQPDVGERVLLLGQLDADVQRVARQRHDGGVGAGLAALVDSSGDDAELGSSPVVNLAIRTSVSLPRGDGSECAVTGGDVHRARADSRAADEPTWRARAAAHEARVDALGASRTSRAARRAITHPVEDFLFTYYSQRPAALRRWHPGYGVALAGRGAVRPGCRATPSTATRRGRPGARCLAAAAARRRCATLLARDRVAARRRSAASGCTSGRWSTGSRSTRSGMPPGRCGSGRPAPTRSSSRTGSRCSHFDAFRFFTAVGPAAATPSSPAATTGPAFEQPGCLHAGMDLYKHAFRLTPLVRSDLVADCFELARDIRELDMRAAPYDLTGRSATQPRRASRPPRASGVRRGAASLRRAWRAAASAAHRVVRSAARCRRPVPLRPGGHNRGRCPDSNTPGRLIDVTTGARALLLEVRRSPARPRTEPRTSPSCGRGW